MFHGSGSPRSSCRLSGKLGRDGSVGVSAFRSVSRAADVLRYLVFPFRFPCHVVRRIANHSPRFSCREAGRRAGSVGCRLVVRPSVPCRWRRFTLLAAMPVPSRPIGSPFSVSPGGVGGDWLGSRMTRRYRVFRAVVLGGAPVHRIRPSRPSPRLNLVARAGRRGCGFRHAIRLPV